MAGRSATLGRSEAPDEHSPLSTLLARQPGPALAPFVERLWAFDERAAPPRERSARERALPTGCASLVVRLSDEPIRIFEGVQDAAGRTFGHAVLAGARARFHVRDTSRPSCSLGVQFRPGGAAALLGLPAGELAGRYTPLEALWGRAAAEARERMAERSSARERLALLEELLLARRAPRPGLHPAVAHALARLESALAAPSTAQLARETGYSQRRLIELFRAAVGLTPKVFARIRRFQRALERAGRGRSGGWARVAAECGYFDQSHLVREFQAIAGLAPGAWRPVAPERPNHVPLREVAGSRTSKSEARPAR